VACLEFSVEEPDHFRHVLQPRVELAGLFMKAEGAGGTEGGRDGLKERRFEGKDERGCDRSNRSAGNGELTAC